MRLLITVIPKGKSSAVCSIIQEGKIHFQTIMKAKGTAPSEILELLSLGDSEKEVIFSLIDSNDVTNILQRLEEKFHFKSSAFGVSYTVDVSTIGKLGFNYLYQDLMEDN
ncbi:MAG: hypothetical protein RBQ91_01555 [Acholeplasma sp.]|nr:hypothetical protein [Acholeplasma sp.]